MCFFLCFLLSFGGESGVFVCSFFFFQQKTAYEWRISDWSSDVCSSDLHDDGIYPRPHDAQADNLRLCVARWPHWHGPFEAPPSLTSDLGARWRAPVDHRQESYFHASYPLGHAGRSVVRHYGAGARSEEHTSELQSLMRISYAVFCLKKKK